MAERSPEDEKLIAEAMTKMAQLMKGEIDLCFRCGTQIKVMEQIGRSVYARPCGCRLWQGTVPEAWKTTK